MATRVLMMPLAAAEAGIGHLRRSVQVAERLPGAALAVPATEADAAAAALATLHARPPIRDSAGGAGAFDVVALDRRATSVAEMLTWTRGGVGVGIDEGGPARRYLPLLLDTVPRPERHSPNAASLRWALAERVANHLADAVGGVGTRDEQRSMWLVSFGGDDPGHLSERVAAALARLATPQTDVVVVAGPRFGIRQWPEDVSVLPPQPSLAPLLRQAALVCTAYGLTAYEALAAGRPVLLANPSRYHQRLAEAAGIPSLGVAAPWRRLHERRLTTLLARPERLFAAVRGVQRLLQPLERRPAAGAAPTSDALPLQGELPDLLRALHVTGPVCCPSCGRRLSPVVARFADRTYHRCRRCRLVHMLRFSAREATPVDYGRAYFFEEYRAQYGRTYLEDFSRIRATGYRRLRHIARLRPASRAAEGAFDETDPRPLPRLLDIGCAFGPFLDAARRRGWAPAGVDVSADAVAHVTTELRLPAMVGSIEALTAAEVESALAPGPGARFGFEAVTMWYVIEHLVDLHRVLRLARELLVDGGVLAFSTPNGAGISARRSLRRFLEQSPGDHYTVWSPRSAREVLRRYGFRIGRTRVTGHHPERFPVAAGRGSWRRAYRVLAGVASRLLRLGDTFEVYATAVERGSDV